MLVRMESYDEGSVRDSPLRVEHQAAASRELVYEPRFGYPRVAVGRQLLFTLCEAAHESTAE